MNALHIFSSAPFFAKEPEGALSIDKTEAYCTVLSALMWRKLNGDIYMYTDPEGERLFEKIGISDVWNGVRAVLSPDLDGIDPIMFWAGAKLLALKNFDAPCVMLDTDFIVWEKLDLGDRLTAAHEEELNPDIYPDISRFVLNGYSFPEGLDFTVKPLNTAFLYLPDEDFKLYYTSQAEMFMRSAQRCDDYLTYMVFAEQRLLPMLAKKCGIEYNVLLDNNTLFFPQHKFTHLWGAKQAMRDDKRQAERFCEKCRGRIRSDFPDMLKLIDSIELFYQ